MPEREMTRDELVQKLVRLEREKAELEARMEQARGGLAAIRAIPASTNISLHLDTLDYILRGEDPDD